MFSNHGVSGAEAEEMIMAARLKAGWVTEEDLQNEAAEGEDAESEAEPAAEAVSV